MEEKNNIDALLTEFCEYFVLEVEAKLLIYNNVLEEKTSATDYVKPLAGAKSPLGAVGILGAQGYQYLKKSQDKGTASTLTKLVHAFKDKEQRVQQRAVLVRAACDIFYAYEMQFVSSKCQTGGSLRAMQKLAKDAACRLLHYYAQQEVAPELSLDTILAAVTCDFKHGIKNTFKQFYLNRVSSVPTTGRKIKISDSRKQTLKKKITKIFSSSTQNTADVFSQVGIMIDSDLHFGFYKTVSSNSSKFGHRRLFTTEIDRPHEIMEILKRDKDSGFKYEYVLNIGDVDKKSEHVTTYLNYIDKNQTESRMKDILEQNRLDISLEIKDMEHTFNIDIKKLMEKLNEMDSSAAKRDETILNNIEEVKLMIRETGRTRIHISFDLKDPVQPFVGRDIEMQDIHDYIRTHMVVISGLAGMGKSELSRQYAFRYNDFYDGNIVWINAETNQTLCKSFLNLAQELDVPKLKDFSERPILLVVNDIYCKIMHDKTLFIFDNAESISIVKDFLPKKIAHGENIKILITSQIQEWHQAKMIPLQELSETESVQLVKENLKDYNSSLNEETIIKLVKLVQYFPLALQQAIAYILDMYMTNENYDMQHYITKLENENELLIQHEFDGKVFPEFFNNSYARTTYSTISLVLEKLQNKQKEPELSLLILNAIAYLAPDNIPNNLFLNWMDLDSLNMAIRSLRKYSLIKVEKEEIFVHRLVQKIIRFIAKTLNKERDNLVEILDLTVTNNTLHILSKHLSSVFQYSEAYIDILLTLFDSQTVTIKQKLFLLSSYNNCPELLIYILDKEPHLIECCDDRNHTALHLAAMQCHRNIITILINKGANLYAKNIFGNTTLIIIIGNNRIEEVIFFVEIAPNFNLKVGRLSILRAALFTKNIELFKYVYNLHEDEQNNSALLYAAAALQCVDIAMFLIKQKLNVNIQDERCETPLHTAAACGEKVISLLVRHGAHLNAQSENGNTPLHEAALRNLCGAVSTLIKLGADKFIRNNLGRQAHHSALVTGPLDTLQMFLDYGFKVNEVTNKWWPTLQFSVCYEYTAKINDLLNNGADINHKDNNGVTPLYVTTIRGNLELIKFLHSKGADIHIRSADGYTLLQEAAIRGYSDVVKLLCSLGANINEKSTDDRLPLHDAVICNFNTKELLMNRQVNMLYAHIPPFQERYDQDSEKHVSHVTTVLDLGADLEARTNLGHTALHEAAICGLFNITTLLIERGAAVNTRCCGGLTPLHDAIVGGYDDVARILIDNHCDLNESGDIPSVKDFADYYKNEFVLRILNNK